MINDSQYELDSAANQSAQTICNPILFYYQLLVTRANTITEKEKRSILQMYNDSLNTIKESVHNYKKDQEVQSEAISLENKSLSEDISFLNLKLNKVRALLTSLNNNLGPAVDIEEARIRDNSTNLNCLKREKYESGKDLIKSESRNIISSVSSDKYKSSSLSKSKQVLRLDNSCSNIRLPVIQPNKTVLEHVKPKMSDISQEKHNNLIEVCRSLKQTYYDLIKQMEDCLSNQSNSQIKMNKFREFSKKIKEVYELLIFNQEKLIFANETLEESNSDLSSQINEFQSIHNKERFCLHCHNTFRMSNNQEVTILF